MEVLQYLGKLKDGHEVVMTTQELTPYVIVTNYNPDTMSWASAYGYYSTLGEMAKGITELEAQASKNKMMCALGDLTKAFAEIEECYDDLARTDKNFENAFSELYPFHKSFDEIRPGTWTYALEDYLMGYRKVGQTEIMSGMHNWGYPDNDEIHEDL